MSSPPSPRTVGARDQRRGVEQSVADEDVDHRLGSRVGRTEVVGVRGEGDVAPVGGDRRVEGDRVRRRPAVGRALTRDQRRVVHPAVSRRKTLLNAVVVVVAQVVGVGREGDVPPVRGDRGVGRARVADCVAHARPRETSVVSSWAATATGAAIAATHSATAAQPTNFTVPTTDPADIPATPWIRHPPMRGHCQRLRRTTTPRRESVTPVRAFGQAGAAASAKLDLQLRLGRCSRARSAAVTAIFTLALAERLSLRATLRDGDSFSAFRLVGPQLGVVLFQLRALPALPVPVRSALRLRGPRCGHRARLVARHLQLHRLAELLGLLPERPRGPGGSALLGDEDVREDVIGGRSRGCRRRSRRRRSARRRRSRRGTTSRRRRRRRHWRSGARSTTSRRRRGRGRRRLGPQHRRRSGCRRRTGRRRSARRRRSRGRRRSRRRGRRRWPALWRETSVVVFDLQVAHEQVREPVVVGSTQVVGVGLEGDVATVGGDRRLARGAVGAGSTGRRWCARPAWSCSDCVSRT